jgi:hypothetical protein
MKLSRSQVEWGCYTVAFVFIVLQVAFISWRLNFLIGTEAVYRTNVHTGITGFGEWWKVYTLPAMLSLFWLSNLGLARFLWPKKDLHRRLLAGQTLALAVLGSIGVFVLVLMNLAYG